MIDMLLIAQVRDLRAVLARRKGEIAAKRAAFERTLQEELKLLKTVTDALAFDEESLRVDILAKFVATGNKAPAPGCGVRMVQNLAYDETVALQWAKEHGIALKLDIKTFEKLAKADKPEFVTITEEPQATIAMDLDKALAEK